MTLTVKDLSHILSVTAAYGAWAGVVHAVSGHKQIDMLTSVRELAPAAYLPPGLSEVFISALQLIATTYDAGYGVAAVGGGGWGAVLVYLLPVIALAPLTRKAQLFARRWRLARF